MTPLSLFLALTLTGRTAMPVQQRSSTVWPFAFVVAFTMLLRNLSVTAAFSTNSDICCRFYHVTANLSVTAALRSNSDICCRPFMEIGV